MFLYLRVTVSMYVSEPTAAEEAKRHPRAGERRRSLSSSPSASRSWSVWLPGFLVDFAHDSVPGLALR